MSFNQKNYISKYNKINYKMYQFRIKRNESKLINLLDGIQNKNGFIISLLKNEFFKDVLSLKQIKESVLPILAKHNINNVYLFGSYARGEANCNSDVDIYCEPGDIKSLFDQFNLVEELESSLKKKVDLVFSDTELHPHFKEQLEKDLIKLC